MMRKNVLQLLAIILVVLFLQNCSKTEYKPVQQQGISANYTSGLKLSVGSTGLYQLIAYNGNTAGVANSSTTPGNSFNSIAYNGSPFQKWQITQASATSFTIRNSGSNLYLQSYNYNGRQVLVQGPFTGSNTQLWSISAIGDRLYKAINEADGLAITDTSNALYQLQPFVNLPTQTWRYNVLTAIDTASRIAISGNQFIDTKTGAIFKVWGFNYAGGPSET